MGYGQVFANAVVRKVAYTITGDLINAGKRSYRQRAVRQAAVQATMPAGQQQPRSFARWMGNMVLIVIALAVLGHIFGPRREPLPPPVVQPITQAVVATPEPASAPVVVHHHHKVKR